MESEIVKAIVTGIVGGACTGIAVIAAIRVELKWLRRDVDTIMRRVFQD